MAKKTTTSSVPSGSIFDLVSSFDKSAEVLAESKLAEISDYIDTGCYILNACATGSLFKGLPCGRVVTLAGPSGCGKSYLAMSVCRNAQKKGYTPIYLDSEAAIDKEFVKRLGCDPDNFIIKQVNTISETSTFIANLCKNLEELPEDQRMKVILVLDSLGNLTSDKEYDDTLNNNQKRDMTKQQEVKALFRTNVSHLGRLGIPMICTAHIYQCVSGDTNIIMGDGSVKNIKDVLVDDMVLTADGERRVAATTAIENTKFTYELEFEDGYTITCTPGHKFLCKDGDGTKWVEADELQEDDEIIQL